MTGLHRVAQVSLQRANLLVAVGFFIDDLRGLFLFGLRAENSKLNQHYGLAIVLGPERIESSMQPHSMPFEGIGYVFVGEGLSRFERPLDAVFEHGEIFQVDHAAQVEILRRLGETE